MKKIPVLKSKRLADVTLVPVETRSRTQMLRVDIGKSYFGFVEKLPAHPGETHPWKAFRQSPGTRGALYVTAFYAEEGGLQAAVACVLDRSLS